jgi:hypothetical protein
MNTEDKIVSENPSKYCQWNECRTTQELKQYSMEEIKNIQASLVKSYKCHETDITYLFRKKTANPMVAVLEKNEDPNNPMVRIDDYLWLVYQLKTVNKEGIVKMRDIMQLKMLVPEAVRRQAAEQLKKR